MKAKPKKKPWRKPPNSRRSKRFDVRLTPVQYERFQRAADELGITKTDMLLRWLAQD